SAQQPLKEREGFSRASWLFRREVATRRERRQSGIRKTHAEIVHLAVELFRREGERVLMMQFVGDARESRDERRRRFQLEVAAAGRRRDLRQPLVGSFHLRLLPSAVTAQAAAAEPADRTGTDPAVAALVAAAAHAGNAVLAGE